jgi:MFS family permease
MIDKKKNRIFYGYWVVAASFLTMALMWGTSYTFGIVFKPLIEEFGWSRAATSGAFSLALVLTGGLAVVTGRLTDRFGPRLVVTVCGCFFGLGCLLISQISTLWQLYLYYGILVGVGMSGSFVPLASTVARWFVKRRGMMTGIAISGLGAGVIIMAPVGGITVLVLIVLAAQLLRRDPAQVGQTPYGEDGLPDEVQVRKAGFTLQQAMRRRQFWLINAAWFCFGLSLGAVMVHIVPHAIGLGISPASAALILAVIGGLSIGGRVVLGGLGDRIGNKLTIIISFILMTAALLWLLAADELWMLFLFAVIWGSGYGGMSALSSSLLAEQFGLSSHGILLGCLMVCAEGGSAIGPVVAGYIYDITGSYWLAFLLFAVIGGVGLILISRVKPGSIGDPNLMPAV